MEKNHRKYNIGKSDYAKHKVQPWDIIWAYRLDYWEGTMLAYLLRNKDGEIKAMDYLKIQHNAREVLENKSLYTIMSDKLRRPMGRRLTIKAIVDDYKLNSSQKQLLSAILNRKPTRPRMERIMDLCEILIQKENKKNEKTI